MLALLAACSSGGPVLPEAMPRTSPSAGFTLAVIQLASGNGDRADNLSRATGWLERAAAEGADLAVFPEFMPTGYSLDYDAWDAAEPRGGPTEVWLGEQARRLGLYVGTSFLEAEGEDFYNTFSLAAPDGRIAGRVRKSTPAGLEGRLFRGDEGPRVIETSLGKVGIGICQESYRCFLAQRVHSEGAEVLLLPHSFPDLSGMGGLEAPPGRFVASWYARQLGIPVAMVNKVGPWQSTLPELPTPIQGRFPGASAIAAAGGEIQAELGPEAGLALSYVSLQPELRRAPEVACTGPFVNDLTLGGPVRRFMTRLQIRAVQLLGLTTLEDRARAAYEEHPDRAERARAAAMSEMNTNPSGDSDALAPSSSRAP